ncbi:MAG: 3-(cis-5,6-dihydroxycyclohexa-1,3-dien-1-yl)propanoate dehydrogenase [Cycloclasticus sp.]|nr:3-(cis-5,6-dihydroxycyclohexa-1,3-dien-1-yl)propanoate dehydrogenase [Cycloclasticus sp.]
MGWLDNKVVLVTGGASGIGLAIVERFLEEGAKICVMDRSQERIDELEKSHAGAVVGIVGDVRSLDSNKAAVEKTVSVFGKLDVFVGNAGIWDYMVPLEAQPDDKVEEIADEIFAVNVKGYVLGAKAALPELRKTKGNMIFTASTSSYYTGGGGPIYVASKHAVIGLIKQLAYEVAPDIRVNGVAPGGTVTNLGGTSAAGQADNKLNEVPGIDKMIGDMTPLGFTAEPKEHAGAYLLLASDQAGYITGTIINSDGGIGVGKRPE